MLTVALVSHAPEIVRFEPFEYVGDAAGVVIVGADGVDVSLIHCWAVDDDVLLARSVCVTVKS